MFAASFLDKLFKLQFIYFKISSIFIEHVYYLHVNFPILSRWAHASSLRPYYLSNDQAINPRFWRRNVHPSPQLACSSCTRRNLGAVHVVKLRSFGARAGTCIAFFYAMYRLAIFKHSLSRSGQIKGNCRPKFCCANTSLSSTFEMRTTHAHTIQRMFGHTVWPHDIGGFGIKDGRRVIDGILRH
jgi:hypothetical protein